jgi:hypothetical protein
MKRVIIESPFAGRGDTEEERAADAARNLEYLRAAMRDCLLRGEAPYASHALYTQPGVLDDLKPDERCLGMNAGFAWRTAAEATVVYEDLGITPGMETGIKNDRSAGQLVYFRRLPGWERNR